MCVSAATSLLSSYNEVADIMHQSLGRDVGGARLTEFWLRVGCVFAGLNGDGTFT